MQTLASCTHFASLRSLVLCGNGIGDGGLSALARLSADRSS